MLSTYVLRITNMNYQTWEATVPQGMKDDSLWKARAYRLSLFLGELSWDDSTKLAQDSRAKPLAGQLYRAVGSIGANIAEGYSRGTSKDRAHFYEYALGSAREARDWYYKARHILSDSIFEDRLQLLTEIIRLLLVMVPNQRGTQIREEAASYQVDSAE